jgi:aspartyl-tRNA(Asn)/glutamyl-tRNA(Gln) amidotransferase subunit B
MRGKEEAHDYRYFPDPDLLPLVLEDEFIDRIRAELPELPDEKKLRFINHYGLSVYDATVLIAERERADFYERVVGGGPDGSRDPKVCANWVITELFGALNKGGHDIDESPIMADQLGGLIDLLADDTISGRIAKDVFAEMYDTGKDAAAIVEEKGLKQVTDTGAIDAVIDEVLAEQADKVAEYRGGKDKLFGFFVGQVMKKTQGKANPKLVNDALRGKLDG